MKLNEFQEASKRTLQTELSHKDQLINYSMGLSGEAGEVLDYIKKIVFHRHELNKLKLTEELGDVLFYLAAICTLEGITLEEVAKSNIEKLIKRYPKGFDALMSINRKESKCKTCSKRWVDCNKNCD